MAKETSHDKAQHTAPETQTPMQTNGKNLSHEEGTVASKMATVALVGLGAALIEVELIPGILIGVAAMLAPDVVPKVGRGLRPLVKSVIRAGYAVTERTKETIAEAGEQIQDIVAEVRSEQETAQQHPAAEETPKHA